MLCFLLVKDCERLRQLVYVIDTASQLNYAVMVALHSFAKQRGS